MVFVSSVPNILGYGGRKDYQLYTDFTGKKYTLKLLNPILLFPFLWGAFVLPVMSSGVSQKDIRVTEALVQASRELSHLAVQTARP